MKIARADIVTAFDEMTIGTKVVDEGAFTAALEAAIAAYPFPENGQGFIHLPASAYPMVSSGVRRTRWLFSSTDFVVREHRGHWGCYAKRPARSTGVDPIEGLACVVYTREAYVHDPDVSDAEISRVLAHPAADYILVAVLAFCGPKSPFPIWTLVHNVAGGNNEFIPKTTPTVPGGPPYAAQRSGNIWHDLDLLHRIVAEAKASEAYWDEWMIVAD